MYKNVDKLHNYLMLSMFFRGRQREENRREKGEEEENKR